MPLPKFSDKQISQIAGFVGSYIAEQREMFAKKAQSISDDHRRKLEPFFPAALLSKVRVVQGRATEPSFYPLLKIMGIRHAPAFSDMAGITFQDVIVHAEELSEQLLFHELVHVVQYEHLGLQGFSERYVRGFLVGGSYEAIPLEKQAYELEARFASDPNLQLSVDADVQERIRANLL